MLPALALALLATQGEPVPIVIHADRPGPSISKNLYGVFFEEINHAGDGGLNPELLRNFNFREPPTATSPMPGWKPLAASPNGSVLMGVGELDLNRTDTTGNEIGAANAGYWGISVTAGAKVRFAINCMSKSDAPVRLRLVDSAGATCAESTIKPALDFETIKGVLTPRESVEGGHFEVAIVGRGAAAIKSISLVPANTWDGHGLRSDLASMVDGLHPAFVRFPGGCYVEGGDYLANRYRWETTLVSPAERPGHRNTTWGYWSTDGLGFKEYLQWCQDMHAEALFVVNCGFSHRETVPMADLGTYLSSTMDALEYALGPATSKYGAVRVASGHPAPFPLRFVEIGNENGQGWPTGGSPSDYAAHYKYFADAIHVKYPNLTLIADTRFARDAQMVDDHYYNSPSWFWRNTGLYDRTPRTGPKIYVGEYAVTSDCGTGNLRAALAEAAFLTGLERNSDLVQMASYAPLFVNVNNRAWNPDAICFNGDKSYGTPSYYAQAMFGANRGDTFLPTDFPQQIENETWTGGIGLGTWGTSAEYKDVSVTAGGKTIYASNFGGGSTDWQPAHGDWSTTDGAYRQTSDEQNVRSFLKDSMAGLGDCTINLKARKLSGAEGFLILFHAKTPDSYLWWNIGGWGNTEAGVEATSPGGKYAIGRHVRFSVDTGKWYDIRIETKGEEMRLTIDGKLIQTARAAGTPSLAVSTSQVAANGDLIVKVVNGSEKPLGASVEIQGVGDQSYSGEATTLTSDSQGDENSLDNPTRVSPKTSRISAAHARLRYDFPSRSLTILRLHRA